jgi:hypothetical protein
MPIPTDAFVFPEDMDPKDQVDYEIDLTGTVEEPGMLEDGEECASFDLTLLAESVAVGLELGTGSRAPVLINTNKGIRVWFEVDSAEWGNAAFDGAGATLPMELTVTTNTSPSRRRQRTLVLEVKQK